ncbi:hypothetical protein J6S55_00465 [Candidatus Saccharibacteria bacterium]|nr:hypothetical protein [Candidatus Saccharibacteria bacterium]
MKETLNFSKDNEVVIDETETLEDKEAQAFNAQLDRGLDFYCQISGEKKEDVDIHPEQELFFSYLDKNSRHELDRTVSTPTLTEYGLAIKDSVYNFTDPYKEQVLRFEAEQIAQGSDDINAFRKNLEAYSLDFKKIYIEKIKKSFVSKAREPFLLEKSKIEKETNARYLQRSIDKVGAETILDRYPETPSAEAKLVYKTIALHDRKIRGLRSEEFDSMHNSGMTKQEFEKKKEQRIKAEEADFNAFKDRYKLQNLNVDELLKSVYDLFEKEKTEFITNGFMTKEEYQEYKNSSQKIEAFVLSIRNNKDLYKRDASEILDAYQMLRESVKVKLGKEYEREHGTEFDYPANKKPFHSQRQSQHNSAVRQKKMWENGELPEEFAFLAPSSKIPPAVPSVEESRKKLEQVFEKYYDGKPWPFSIDEAINLTERHLELAEKYRRGEVKFGVTPTHAKHYISEEKGRLTEQMYKQTESISYRHAEESANKIAKKLASGVFGIDNTKEVVFTPSGCFIELESGTYEMKPISPFDARIETALNPDETEAWENTWNTLQANALDEGAKKGKENKLADFVNHQFREMVDAFSDSIDDKSFRQLQELREKFRFDIAGLFDGNSKMNHFPTSQEIQFLGETIPGIADFITDINFNAVKDDGHHKIDLKTLTSNLKMAICGGNYSSLNAVPNDLVYIQDGGAVLNFFSYQKILYDTNYDHKKARSVLYSCLGYELMRTLEDEKIREFATLLGEKANISKQSIFRNYGIVVANPAERRKIAIRTYFVSEFNKFALGTADDDYKKFFNSLAG